HLPPKKLVAFADKEVLTKILSNLVSNALKYAKKEVRISVAPDHKTKSLSIEIDNDGFLIPEEMREKVFEPFVRLKGTEKQQGTGIGLALARSLTELHQGTLVIEPGNKDFNRFLLRLPLLQMRPTLKNNIASQNTIIEPTV
ncbi:MAG TPA: ATP-binding protein, partial [Ferruginibacter sp.]|nr:ATP-binding protein [Ferruginibacter sp.]